VAAGVAQGYAGYGLLARPGSLPGARWVALYGDAPGIVWSALVGFILLLTPTGSLPPPPSLSAGRVPAGSPLPRPPPGPLPWPPWRWWPIATAAAPAVFLLAQPLGAGLLDGPAQ